MIIKTESYRCDRCDGEIARSETSAKKAWHKMLNRLIPPDEVSLKQDPLLHRAADRACHSLRSAGMSGLLLCEVCGLAFRSFLQEGKATP